MCSVAFRTVGCIGLLVCNGLSMRRNIKIYLNIIMTLTTPMCPVAETLPPEVEEKIRGVDGVGIVNLDLVWEPPWSPDMMSEAAKLQLNF